MVDVHIPSVGKNFATPRPKPFSSRYAAPLLAGKGDYRKAFGNQGFGSRVLAITVGINPMPPVAPVVIDFAAPLSNRQLVQNGNYFLHIRW